MDNIDEIEHFKSQIALVRTMIAQLEDHPEYRAATDILFKIADRVLVDSEAIDREHQFILGEIERLVSS